MIIDKSEQCIKRNTECNYYCKHNEGCALLITKDHAFTSIVKDISPVDKTAEQPTSTTQQVIINGNVFNAKNQFFGNVEYLKVLYERTGQEPLKQKKKQVF